MIKKNIILLFCFTLILISCYSENNNDYEQVSINIDEYYFSNNWQEIEKLGNLILFYKTKKINGQEIITNFYYSLKNKNDEYVYLGGFDVNKGFINNKKKYFVKRKAVSDKSNFIKNDLQGISIKLLHDPFVVIGIVKDEKNLYETETIEYFYIDTNLMSIQEWFPEW
ncbi:MAG: hypothetical protein K6A43_13340 [Treponema sp.]|nr:hypothetical protein [Treponema sp.]